MKNSIVIASITFKEIVRQPLFVVVMLGGIILMAASSSFALFGFGEEERLIKDMAVSTITIIGILVSVFYTANSFTDDARKTTVVTILCKSINKNSFIVGRFFGTAMFVFLVNVVLVAIFWLIIFLYNLNGEMDYGHGHLFNAVFGTIIDNKFLAGVYLSFLQVLILGSLSLFLSVNVTAVANIAVCFGIYIFGHLSNQIGSISQNLDGALLWFSKLLFLVIPGLYFFDLDLFHRTTVGGSEILFYLLWASFYTFSYSLIFIVATIFSFQKKDLL